MGLKSLAIALPAGRDVFYSGETIQGFVEFEVDYDSHYEYMELTFHGGARVHWTETRSTGTGKNRRTRTVHYSASETFFNFSQRLTNGGLSFTGGIYRIPFTYVLAPHLVSSMEGSYGYVRYQISAKPPGNWFTSLFKASAVARLRVLQIIDIGIPHYNFVVSGTDKKTICCCCCASGPLIVEAKTDRAAYCPGDIVTIAANFQNNSSKKVKPYAKLQQKRMFRAQGKTRTSTTTFDLIPIDAIDGQSHELGEGGNTSWNGMKFQIPPCFPSLQCSIIQVTYYIEVGIDIPWAFDLEVYLPVVIGTINNTVNQGQPQPSAPPLPPYVGTVSPQPINTVQPSSSIGWQTPWSGVGKQQSGGVLPSAPPLPSTYQEVNVAPPSYFTAIMAGEKAVLGDSDDDNEK